MLRHVSLCAAVASANAFAIGGACPRPAAVRASSPAMKTLAEEMFGDVFKGISDMTKKIGDAADAEDTPAPPSADDVVSDLDARAQKGELTFGDFLTMSRAFSGMGDDSVEGALAGAGKLTPAELAETRQKFAKHERIVEVMLPEEVEDPALLVDDVKSGGATPGPRLQRLAKASNLPETEVALFVMQFEAMRESTRRIAAGEDPDEVNESMMNPNANRQARRNAAKAAKKSAKKKSKNKM